MRDDRDWRRAIGLRQLLLEPRHPLGIQFGTSCVLSRTMKRQPPLVKL